MRWNDFNMRQQAAVVRYSKLANSCKDIPCSACPLGTLDYDSLTMYKCAFELEESSFITYEYINQKCKELVSEGLADILEEV